MMTTDQYEKIDWPDNKMGLGFSIATEKSAAKSPVSPGSFAWGGMFSSSYWIDPKEKIVAQLFLNQYPQSHGEVHDKFKVLVYQALK
jgi:CubicO group peptidase (beta-lactamase class C family)